MIREGQIVLFRFPQADQVAGKMRPALVLRQAPGRHNDWLVCMISTQLDQAVPGFDEVLRTADSDFSSSGLREESVIRVARLAVVNGSVLLGAIGEIPLSRLKRIKNRLVDWIRGA